MDRPANIARAIDQIDEPWQPHRVARVNDYDLKVVKLHGEFVWHTHPDTDELFIIRSGHLIIQLRDRDVHLGPDDVYVVAAGVEHCPRALDDVTVLIVEPQGTVNTGDAGGDRTFLVRD